MITKELFMDCVTAIKDYTTFVDNVCEASEEAVVLYESPTISNLANCLQELLEYCTNDKDDVMSNLDYFMWEQDFGKKADDYFITDANGVTHKTHDIDEFWDYITEMNPSIEDTGEESSTDNEEISDDVEAVSENDVEDRVEKIERKMADEEVIMEHLGDLFDKLMNYVSTVKENE